MANDQNRWFVEVNGLQCNQKGEVFESGQDHRMKFFLNKNLIKGFLSRKVIFKSNGLIVRMRSSFYTDIELGPNEREELL